MPNPVSDNKSNDLPPPRWEWILVYSLPIGMIVLAILNLIFSDWHGPKIHPSVKPAILAYQRYLHYEKEADQALALLPKDPTAARKMLEDAIAKGRAEGVLPDKILPESINWPSEGEIKLLDLYLDDRTGTVPETTKREFIEYIKKSYPTYNFEAYRSFNQYMEKRKAEKRKEEKQAADGAAINTDQVGKF